MALTDDLTNIANAIREKAGTSEKMKVSEMASNIRGISGAATSGFATVTFFNLDSAVYSRPVYIGDDCPDPVAQGRIQAPTRESTETTEYTFSGWTEGLTNVTADTFVYARYRESVRYFTVYFYDGDTLLHTEKVPYGGSSSYKYLKEELMFAGWTPEPTNVTGDMYCYGEWLDLPNFETSSWETIKQISESGRAADTFSLGDERDITLTYADGTTEVVTLQIVGFNQVATAVGTPDSDLAPPPVLKTAGITMATKHVIGRHKRQHTSGTTGTPASHTYQGAVVRACFGLSYTCELYDYVHNDIFNALPPQLAEILEPQFITRTTNQNTYALDNVFVPISLLSARNLTGDEYTNGSTYTSSHSLQQQFSWFKDEKNRVKTDRGGSDGYPYWISNNIKQSSSSGYYTGVYCTSLGTLATTSLSNTNKVVLYISI